MSNLISNEKINHVVFCIDSSGSMQRHAKEVRVSPGKWSDLRVFVNSTSTNRLLVKDGVNNAELIVIK